MTMKEQLNKINGVKDIYDFVIKNEEKFIQTKWNQYFAKDDSCWMLFSFDSCGNAIGCKLYC